MKSKIGNSIDQKNKCLDFYSEDMYVSKKFFIDNHLKLTYQKQLISNLDNKHKEWSRFIES